MKIYKILFALLLVAFGKDAYCQDIHWTMFDMSPLSLNPAYSGDHNKSVRAGINYRGQWNSISNSSGFKTSTAFVDAPFFSAGKNSWVGFGLMLLSDKSGSINLSNTGVLGSVAAHLTVNRNSILSLGFQGGLINRKFDTSNILLEEQINIEGPNMPFNSSLNNGKFIENPSINHADLSIGLKYYSKFDNDSDFILGGSIRHIATMNNFIGADNLPFLLTVHGRLNVMINKKWSFLPAVNYYKMESANQVNLQGLMSFRSGSRNSKFAINTGLAYRAIGNDALMAIFQVDFNAYKIGLSYDLNISELSSETNGNGGLEFAFIYTAGQKKNFKSKVGCPTNF